MTRWRVRDTRSGTRHAIEPIVPCTIAIPVKQTQSITTNLGVKWIVCAGIGRQSHWIQTEGSNVLDKQTLQTNTAIIVVSARNDTLVVDTVTGDTVSGSPANRSFFLLWLTGTAGLVGTAVRDTIRRRCAQATDRDHARLLQEAQSRRTLGVVCARVPRRR